MGKGENALSDIYCTEHGKLCNQKAMDGTIALQAILSIQISRQHSIIFEEGILLCSLSSQTLQVALHERNNL